MSRIALVGMSRIALVGIGKIQDRPKRFDLEVINIIYSYHTGSIPIQVLYPTAPFLQKARKYWASTVVF